MVKAEHKALKTFAWSGCVLLDGDPGPEMLLSQAGLASGYSRSEQEAWVRATGLAGGFPRPPYRGSSLAGESQQYPAERAPLGGTA